MIQITDYLDYLSKQSFPINIETIRDTTSQFGAKVQQLSAEGEDLKNKAQKINCLLYTSPSPRDGLLSRMPSSA